MAAIRFDIISIGTLSRNRLWNESAPVRTAHATTTLIRSGKRNILVDPGLPGAALAARLYERTGLRPSAIDTVFLTNFRPSHRGGIELFTHANLLAHEIELNWARGHLQELLSHADEQDDNFALLQGELRLLGDIKPADDKLAKDLDLFPLPGYTPGTCGLLITAPTLTTLLTGDAVPTQDHFLAGQVLPDAYDIKAAQEAIGEVYEIADLIIPSHDNVFINPRSRGM